MSGINDRIERQAINQRIFEKKAKIEKLDRMLEKVEALMVKR